MAIGLFLLLFLQFGLPVMTATESQPAGFRVAFPWLAVIGAGSTFLAGLIISLLLPHRVIPTNLSNA
jgi:hypothetical protein